MIPMFKAKEEEALYKQEKLLGLQKQLIEF